MLYSLNTKLININITKNSNLKQNLNILINVSIENINSIDTNI